MNLVSLFSRKIVSLITKNKNITQEDLDVYIYVFDFIIQNVIFYGLMILIGIISSKVKEMCVFFIVFLLLRKTAGGAHARTPDSCMFFSIIIFVANIYGTELFNGICFQVNLIIEIALATIIIVLAPVDSVNNMMDLNTKKRYKYITLILVLLITLISIIIPILHSVIMCYISVLILLIIGRVENRKLCNRESNK